MARTTTPYRVKDFPKKPTNLKKPKARTSWEVDAPSKEERVQMYKKCRKCILVPPKKTDDKADPVNYKFPICTKLGKTKGECQFNCKGVLAANRRARLTKKYPKVVALTSKLIETWQCTKKATIAAASKKVAPAKPKPKRKVVATKPKRKVVATKPKRKVVASKPKRKVVASKPKRKVVASKPKRKVVAKKPKISKRKATSKPKAR